MALQAVTNLIPEQYRGDFLRRVDGTINSIYESLVKKIGITDAKDKGDFYSEISSTKELFAEASNEFISGNVSKGKVKANELFNKIYA